MNTIDPDKFEGFRISVSGLRDFIHCQWKYALFYIHKIEKKAKNSSFAFGSAFHEGAEPIWYGRKSKFEAAWSKFEKDKSVEYKNGENWHLLHEKGKRMTDALKSVIKDKIVGKPIVELPDPVMVDDHLVTRRLDFIGEVNKLSAIIDGKEKRISGPVILDLKSAARKYHVLDGISSMQLRGYMLPLNSHPDIKPKYAMFIVVTKTINPQVQVVGTRVSPEAILDFKRNVKAAASQVKLGKFSKNMGSHCTWCDFYDCCYKTPDWKSKYQKRQSHVGPVQKAK